MAIERNGITFMSSEEARDPTNPAVKALSAVNLGDVRFPNGFFIRDDNGKKFVVPATWQDKLKVLRTAFPDFPDDPSFRACEGNDEGRECIGGCSNLGDTFRCVKMHDPGAGFFGCSCIDFF